ncbi:MAG: 4'-phosphopantetheinyl transferase superfamily protein [Bacteroidota bacterium]
MLSGPFYGEFQYTKFGKPFLQQATELHFNLSHTDGYALMAFSQGETIGVDVEPINERIEIETLVHRFFSPVEISTIIAMQPADRPAAFFRLWTRKEALIKAQGAGLSLPLAQFGISVKEEEEVRVLHTDWAPEEAQKWSIASFTVAPTTLGAIARKAPFRQLQFYDYC